jgi:hypothetical protein
MLLPIFQVGPETQIDAHPLIINER